MYTHTDRLSRKLLGLKGSNLPGKICQVLRAGESGVREHESTQTAATMCRIGFRRIEVMLSFAAPGSSGTLRGPQPSAKLLLGQTNIHPEAV